MDAAERRALAVAVGAAVVDVARSVEQVQALTQSRVRAALRPLGAAAAVPLAVTSAGTTAVHLAIRGTTERAAATTGQALAATTSPTAPPMGDTIGGAKALAVLHAAMGEPLGPDLAVPLALRAPDGRRVDPADPAATLPTVTGRLVVFVHGLGHTEQGWGAPPYGSDLLAGSTPLTVRYGTGAPVATNATALADLLADVVGRWPVRVSRIVLVGHSMGGLVAVGAVAAPSAATWLPLVTDVVTLGSPHEGAWLARGVERLAAVLRAIPDTSAYARLLDRRSAGIRDLERPGPTLPPAPVRSTLVAGSIGRVGSLPSRLFGDAMVGIGSATAATRPGRAGIRVHRVPGVSHAALLRHPDVTAVLTDALA